MAVLLEKIPQEIQQMSELEFVELFTELRQYIDSQKWNHLLNVLTTFKSTIMETIKELLLKAGLTRKESEVGAAALTHITGDHIWMYESINELCASKDRLGEITAQLSTLSAIVPQKPVKRSYTRKPVDGSRSLVTQAFDANATEALNDQKPEPEW